MSMCWGNGLVGEDLRHRLEGILYDAVGLAGDVVDLGGEISVIAHFAQRVHDGGEVDIAFQQLAEAVQIADGFLEVLHVDAGDAVAQNLNPMLGETDELGVSDIEVYLHEFIARRGSYGRIINLSTDAAQSFPGQITYGASKATMEALIISL